MIERVVYLPEASADVAQAYAWYEERAPGVEAAVLTIQRHPQLHPVAVDDFRHALIRRFPFEIFYESAREAIVIYSVFHCSQDPQKWRKRLGENP
jgi:plasmid stabilization system protein ParE